VTHYPDHANTPLDIEVWSRMSVWESWPLASILLGREPRWSPRNLAERNQLRKMEDMVMAARRGDELLGTLSETPLPPEGCVFPAAVVAWVRKREIPVHPRFDALINSLEKQGLLAEPASVQTLDQPEQTSRPRKASTEQRERNNLLRMIYAMAAEKFGYSRGSPATLASAAKKIGKAMEDRGLKYSDQSIRDKLQEAADAATDTDLS
jgi:hypothetical protein